MPFDITGQYWFHIWFDLPAQLFPMYPSSQVQTPVIMLQVPWVGWVQSLGHGRKPVPLLTSVEVQTCKIRKKYMELEINGSRIRDIEAESYN